MSIRYPRRLNKQDRAFVKKIRTCFGKTIIQNQLIAQNDRLVVGVSGGKDSLSLLELLAERRHRLPVHYELHAVYVDIANLPYKADIPAIRELCNRLDVRFHYHQETVHMDKDKNNVCFICSWNRRRILFEQARQLNAGTVALGHHKDDAVETLLMNMAFQAEISAMPTLTQMFDGRIYIIRPLLELAEADLSAYAQIQGLDVNQEPCPYEEQTQRSQVKAFIRKLEEQVPHAKQNIYQSMKRIMPQYLPGKQ